MARRPAALAAHDATTRDRSRSGASVSGSSLPWRRRSESMGLLVARLIVGGIFLLAGITKVGSPGAFADAVRAYHILPPSLVLPFAYFLPWVELLAVAYLLLGFMTRVGAILAGLMLVGFTCALGYSLATGNTAHACGCFGAHSAVNPIVAFLAGGNTITWWDVIRDVILLALAVVLAVRGPGKLAIDRLVQRRRGYP